MVQSVIGVAVPEMLIQIGWGTYLFFGVMCTLAGIYTWFIIPETARKSLEEISQSFGDNLAEEDAAVVGGTWMSIMLCQKLEILGR